MKKIIAVFLCLALLLACAAVSADQVKSDKVSIGKISINGAFDLQCGIPEGYYAKPITVSPDQIIGMFASEDPSRPVMMLSIAFDETYSEVERLNDLDDEALNLLEATYTDSDPTVDLSYGETGYGTRLLIARQTGEDVTNYVSFLSIYKGYFVEFVLIPSQQDEDAMLSDEDLRMCIDFLTDLDFVPVTEGDGSVDIAGKTFPAVITGYDAASNTLAIALRKPVSVEKEAAEALKIGDTLKLGETEEEVYALETLEDGAILVNDETELRPQEDGTYGVYSYEHQLMANLTTVNAKMPDTAVFADGIDPESLEMLDEAKIYTAAEFLAEMEAEKENGVGFSADNITVTFDENGELTRIERIYVPWQ